MTTMPMVTLMAQSDVPRIAPWQLAQFSKKSALLVECWIKGLLFLFWLLLPTSFGITLVNTSFANLWLAIHFKRFLLFLNYISVLRLVLEFDGILLKVQGIFPLLVG